jgi:hypothetical protein
MTVLKNTFSKLCMSASITDSRNTQQDIAKQYFVLTPSSYLPEELI